MTSETETALDLLGELVAIVRGECPSLLSEDSGGSAELSMRIDAALSRAPEAGREGAEQSPCSACGGSKQERWMSRAGEEVGPCSVCQGVEPDLIERLLDAQQDINLAANGTMDQSLCNASALIDEIEPILRRALSPPSTGGEGEEFLEFKEALSDIRALRQEHRDLNGGGPGWTVRNQAAWARVDELFANEDEAAYDRQQEDAHG